MQEPPKLEEGDTIALVSPSGSAGSLFPHRMEAATEALQELGFETKEYSTTRSTGEFNWNSGTPEERAEDLMSAFTDEDVDGILTTIGGLTADSILPHLDFEEIKDNPKFFCGYSDITVIHYALNEKANLQTFYGPAAITQFGEHPEPLEYTVEHFMNAVEREWKGDIEPSEEWTDELLDWMNKEDLERPRERNENNGYEWLREGSAEGEIIGGCIPSLLRVSGTEYWPDHEDKIMILETPEGEEAGTPYTPDNAEADLAQLQLMGVLDEINGIVIGRPYQYSEEQEDNLKDIVERYTETPVLYGADIGHTDPQVTVPYGAEAKIDSEENLFKLK